MKFRLRQNGPLAGENESVARIIENKTTYDKEYLEQDVMWIVGNKLDEDEAKQFIISLLLKGQRMTNKEINNLILK